MTGTALTEETEFGTIYSLDVVEIPTNRPVVRLDQSDVVYKTELGKFRAIIRQVKECHAKGQPVLVGTISIEKSEILSKLLKREGIPHNVLNAKYHEQEAQIVAQAGKLGAVTIATNMAGRGTDIRLGGNPDYMAKADMRGMGIADDLIYEASGHAETDDEAILNARRLYTDLYQKHKDACAAEAKEVIAAGGLFILGTERHESRRIDNQLRGRAGRQGDMGYSRFFLSLEDDLMRLFGGDRVKLMMNTLNIDEDLPIENKLLTSVIENAQKKVEDMNFERRKHVLEYDDVINKQRETIYDQRRKVLNGEDIHESIMNMIHGVISDACARYLVGSPEQWNLDGLRHEFLGLFLTPDDRLPESDIESWLLERAEQVYAAREAEFGSPQMREMERVVLLRTVDSKWVEHIDAMDDLKQGISLRSYANVQPVVAYRNEGADMYAQMIDDIRYDTVRLIFRIRIAERKAVAKVTGQSHGEAEKKTVTVIKANKVGRNDPCPCGSGKKYKHCCGKE
jgi:preprotein translocase subunit SecA